MKRHSLALLCAVSYALCSQAGPPPASHRKAGRATPPAADPPIPKSVFVIPASPAEGRNPFFPHTAVGPEMARIAAAAARVSDLVLNGITSPPRKLALINGRTFEEGETGAIKLPSGANVEVTCLEIKAETAVVKVGSQRVELQLRHGD